MNYEEIRKRLMLEFEAAKKLELNDVTNGTFQVMTLQTIQEMEKRRLECMKQAEQLRMQAHAAESQAQAFSVVGSVMTAIVHGFVANEERRLDEDLRRQRAAEENAREEAAVSTPPEAQTSDEPVDQESGDKPKKRAAPKKQ